MQSRRPASFNVVQGDTMGTTWALPEGAIARLGKGIHRSGPYLDSVVLSPDGTYFAAGTGMGLWWYDVSSMSPIALWETECGLISAVEISPDGKLIAIANWDGIVKVMNVQSGEIIARMKQYKLYAFVDFLAFSPDSRLVAAAPWKSGIEVLDVQHGMCITQLKLEPIQGEFNVTAQVEFSPDGQYLAVTEIPTHSDNGGYTTLPEGSQIAIWDPKTGELIAKFPGSKFAFSLDSRLIACACPEDTGNDADDSHHRLLSVWDIRTGKRVAHFAGHEHWINAVTFSPCCQFLVSGDRGGNLRVWELATDILKDDWTHDGIDPKHWNMDLWNMQKFSLEFVMSRLVPSYSPEDGLFAVVFPDNTHTVEVWNAERREQLNTIERLPGSVGAVWFAKCPALAIAYTLSSAATKTNKTHIFLTLREPTFQPLTDSDLDSMRFSRDGQTIVSHSYGGRFTSSDEGGTLWNVPPKQKYGLVKKLHSRILRTLLSDAARKQAFKTLTTEQKAEQERAWEILRRDSDYSSIDWSKKKDSRTYSITVSPYGNIIAVGLDGEIRLCGIEKPITLSTIPQPKDSPRPYALAFSPCGRYLASGTWWQQGMEKMAIRLWNVATGENIYTFWGHTTDVQSLAFSPDGALLASGGFDGTILLWDVKPFIGS